MSFFFNFENSLNSFEFMTKDDFLIEAQVLAESWRDLIERYGKKEEVVSLFVTGLVENDEDNNKYMKAIYGFNLWSEEELVELIEFAVDAYMETEAEDPFGFDISLN